MAFLEYGTHIQELHGPFHQMLIRFPFVVLSGFRDLYDKLRGQTKSLHMWTARVFNNLMPPDFTVFTLNVSLRSPGAVTREVECAFYVCAIAYATKEVCPNFQFNIFFVFILCRLCFIALIVVHLSSTLICVVCRIHLASQPLSVYLT